jgi:hypothetical protein
MPWRLAPDCTRTPPRPITTTAAPRAGYGRRRPRPRALRTPRCRARATIRVRAAVPSCRVGHGSGTSAMCRVHRTARGRDAPHGPVCVRKGSPRFVRDLRLPLGVHRSSISAGTDVRPVSAPSRPRPRCASVTDETGVSTQRLDFAIPFDDDVRALFLMAKHRSSEPLEATTQENNGKTGRPTYRPHIATAPAMNGARTPVTGSAEREVQGETDSNFWDAADRRAEPRTPPEPAADALHSIERLVGIKDCASHLLFDS